MSLPPFFLEPATEDDLPALLDLERRSFSHPWTARHFREEMSGRERRALLVLRARAAPFAPGRGILAYCAYQMVADELHVLNLAVALAHRRRGLARWLLGVALDLGSRGGARRAFLEVRASNAAALALYDGMGFAVVSVRRGYYADPREDALVLMKPGLGARAPAGVGNDP